MCPIWNKVISTIVILKVAIPSKVIHKNNLRRNTGYLNKTKEDIGSLLLQDTWCYWPDLSTRLHFVVQLALDPFEAPCSIILPVLVVSHGWQGSFKRPGLQSEANAGWWEQKEEEAMPLNGILPACAWWWHHYTQGAGSAGLSYRNHVGCLRISAHA